MLMVQQTAKEMKNDSEQLEHLKQAFDNYIRLTPDDTQLEDLSCSRVGGRPPVEQQSQARAPLADDRARAFERPRRKD